MKIQSPEVRFSRSTTAIGEPSFADVLAEISSDAGLCEQDKRYWSTSIRQMAKYLDMPVSLIPARITGVGSKITALHPAQLNLNPKTFANHRATTRKALNWYRDKQGDYGRKGLTSNAYKHLLKQIECRHHRDVLSPFLRFLTVENVAADAICDSHIEAYTQFRNETSFKPINRANIRTLVRHLNTYSGELIGWPSLALTEPAYAKRHQGPSWDELLDGLKQDIGTALERRARPRRLVSGKRLKGCQKSTLDRINRQLMAFIRKAKGIGMPVAGLSSLAELLHPDLVEKVLDAYWQQNGENPSSYTIDLADTIYSLARYDTDLDEAAIERLRDLAEALAEYRQTGMTEKNRALVRQVLNSDLWTKVQALPLMLMRRAEAERQNKPVTAAVMAQLAVAIHLLSVAPVRMKNLSAIRLDENLVQPRGPGTPYLLTFPGYDVKNGEPLEFPLPERTTALLETYIHNHRPQLMYGQNHDFLFPAERHAQKDPGTLGGQISALIDRELGLKITPHQFRHAAGAIILKHHPGNYELVRRVLGHKSLAATTRFYIGLESLTAAKQFVELVEGMLPDDPASENTRNRK